MNILITSGGALGTLLYNALRDQHYVRVLRRRPDPAFGAACVIGDIGCYDHVAHAMEGCELIFHTAVRNNTDIELDSYGEFITANVNGTFNVFLAALRQGVGRIVHSSTSMVTGFHEIKPCDDRAVRVHDYSPYFGPDIYSFTKMIGEQTADYFRRRYQMSIISLRYGWLAPLSMYRDPAMIYNVLGFCFHEQDALACNLLVMNQHTTGNYLINAPLPFTDADARNLWRDPEAVLRHYFPRELEYLRSINFKPTPIPMWLDCSRAMHDLGYRPRYDFPRFVQMHRDGAFPDG